MKQMCRQVVCTRRNGANSERIAFTKRENIMEWLRAAAYIALVIATFTATFVVAKI
jgi:hypothetical protein